MANPCRNLGGAMALLAIMANTLAARDRHEQASRPTRLVIKSTYPVRIDLNTPSDNLRRRRAPAKQGGAQ